MWLMSKKGCHLIPNNERKGQTDIYSSFPNVE